MASRKSILSAEEQYANAELFHHVYPDYDIDRLPSWIKENMEETRVIGTTKQTLLLPDGRRYQLNNTLNHMSGSEWTYFINSVFSTAYKTTGEDSYAHKIRKIHPTPKPPQLMRNIIEFFTKENELVLDYFMGVGGTLLGAGLCGRRAVGIELSPIYIETYKKAAESIGCPIFDCIEGDCLNVLSDKDAMRKLLGEEQVSLVLIDPPY